MALPFPRGGTPARCRCRKNSSSGAGSGVASASSLASGRSLPRVGVRGLEPSRGSPPRVRHRHVAHERGPPRPASSERTVTNDRTSLRGRGARPQPPFRECVFCAPRVTCSRGRHRPALRQPLSSHSREGEAWQLSPERGREPSTAADPEVPKARSPATHNLPRDSESPSNFPPQGRDRVSRQATPSSFTHGARRHF